jgi:hypothetical protein
MDRDGSRARELDPLSGSTLEAKHDPVPSVGKVWVERERALVLLQAFGSPMLLMQNVAKRCMGFSKAAIVFKCFPNHGLRPLERRGLAVLGCDRRQRARLDPCGHVGIGQSEQRRCIAGSDASDCS